MCIKVTDNIECMYLTGKKPLAFHDKSFIVDDDDDDGYHGEKTGIHSLGYMWLPYAICTYHSMWMEYTMITCPWCLCL